MNKYNRNKLWSKPGMFILFMIFAFSALFIFKEDLRVLISGRFGNTVLHKSMQRKMDNYEYTFLEFGAKNCMACKKMENEMKYIDENHANVEVVFHNVITEEGRKYADYYGVILIPTQILLDKSGNEIFRHTGFIKASELEFKMQK